MLSTFRDGLTPDDAAERVHVCASCGTETTEVDDAGRCPGARCALVSRMEADAPLALVGWLRGVVADTTRDAVIGDLAALDADASEMPWTLAWTPSASALIPAVGA